MNFSSIAQQVLIRYENNDVYGVKRIKYVRSYLHLQLLGSLYDILCNIPLVIQLLIFHVVPLMVGDRVLAYSVP